MKQNGKQINLLPKVYIQEQKIKKYLIFAALGLAVECVIFAGVFVVSPSIDKAQVDKTLNAKMDELKDPKYEGVNQTIRQLEETQAALDAWKVKYASLKTTDFVSARMLDNITGRVPMGVNIQQLSLVPPAKTETGWGAASITLNGEASNSVSAYNYITLLETSYGASQITSSVTAGSGEENITTYNVTITIPGTETVVADATQENTQSTETTEGGLE